MSWRWIFHRPACSQLNQHNFGWFQEDSPRHYPQGIAIGTHHQQGQFFLVCLWQSLSQQKTLNSGKFCRVSVQISTLFWRAHLFQSCCPRQKLRTRSDRGWSPPGCLWPIKTRLSALYGRKMCWNLKSKLCAHKWKTHNYLVGGFNPIENKSKNGESFPNRGWK